MTSGFISQQRLEDAVLYRLFVYSQEEETDLTAGQVQSLFSIGVSSKRVIMALKELDQRDFATLSSGSDYLEDTYSITRKGYMKVEEELVKPDSFLAQYALQGDDWLTLATVAAGVPASDRIVTRSDNEQVFDKLETGIEDLITEVSKSNSVEEETGEPLNVVVGELKASKSMLSQGQFHLKRLISLLLPILRKLADKFSSGAIGKLAGQLVEELMKLL